MQIIQRCVAMKDSSEVRQGETGREGDLCVFEREGEGALNHFDVFADHLL